MNTSHPRRIGREAAEQLLGGDLASHGPGSGQDRLTRLLAAAAAPGRDSELAGENVAVSAFQAKDLVPVTKSRRGQMIKSPLAKLLTAKAMSMTLAGAAAGGVGLAAASGAFSGSVTHPKSAGLSASGQQIGSVHTSAGNLSGGAAMSGRSPSLGSLPHPSTAQLAEMCQMAASDLQSGKAQISKAAAQAMTVTGLEKAMANPAMVQVMHNPAFASLVRTARSATNAPDFCGLLLNLPSVPVPGSLSALPASAISQIPVSDLSKLNPSVLSQLPPSILAGMPAPSLAALPAPTLAELPASSLATLPAPELAKLPPAKLSQMPKSTLMRLSPATLSKLSPSALSKLSPATLSKLSPSALSKLSPATLSKLSPSALSELSPATLSKLSPSALSKLPASKLSQLSPSVLSKLPASVLAKLPASVRSQLPSSVLSQLP